MKNFIERLEKLKEFYKGSEYQFACNSISDAAIEIYNELHPSTEIPAPEPEKQAKEGSFKVRVTKADCFKWYNKKIGEIFDVNIKNENEYRVLENGVPKGYIILKSDCEIIPETTTIPFDYDRWKTGDYLRVVTKSGHEVKEIKEFNADILFNFCGVLDHKIHTWDSKGSYSAGFSSHDEDLHLEIATPKEKEKLFTADDMELCFNESRLTNTLVGFKHDNFGDFLKSLIINK